MIPALNESARLPRLLAELQSESEETEIIVADGGSCDDTAVCAAARGARIVKAPRGRGQQLRAGAGAARGDVLLFLHADSQFRAGGLARITATLAANPEVVGGNFRLVFDGEDGFSRWLTRFYARIRARGLYYGDSGVFVRRPIYEALGGVRPIALMEDYDFVRRMERFGRTVCIVDPPLVTSSRRFAGRRPVRIILGWIAIHALFLARLSHLRLARLYDSERRTTAHYGLWPFI